MSASLIASALGLGLAATAPLAAILGFRYLKLRGAIDERARRSLAARSCRLAAASFLASSLAFAFRGSLSAPAAWQLALSAAAALLFLRALRPLRSRGDGKGPRS